MAKFVLIHGMFHGAWCWDKLLPALAAHGHSAIVPNLAGCAGDPTPAQQCTLDRWTDDITALIIAQDEPVIVVGHSRGGLVTSQVAENAAEQVAAAVYLTAILLPDATSVAMLGEQLAQSAGDEAAIPFPAGFSDDGLYLLPPDPDVWFHDGYSAEERVWSHAHIAPEPSPPLAAPVHLTAGRYGKVPRFYIETLQDIVLPIAAQRAMAAFGQPLEVLTLDSGHMPTVTHVEELAAMLDDIARRVAG